MPKKTTKGKVTSDKMDKTVVVSAEVARKHKVYKKMIFETRKYKARDEMGVSLGDTVVIEETTPYSKTVTWKVIENLSEKAK